MISKSSLAAMTGGMALGAVLSLAAVALAQQTGTPMGQAGVPMAQTGAPLSVVPRAPGTGGDSLHVVSMAADTFVTVKDNGDSQTVSVFKLEAKDMARLAHKAKFFYGTGP